MEVKWCGLDFGQSLMDPSGVRTYWVVGDVCKELGKPELSPQAVNRFRVLVEACGDVNQLKEAHRTEILTYVFDGDEEAMELFSVKEKDYMGLAEGAEEALRYMREQGISVNVVAELKKVVGELHKNVISRFLKSKNVVKYFDYLYTPQGRISLRDDSVDDSYKGKTKESGQLYERLIAELQERGIKPGEMLIVGDNVVTDINPPHRLGIRVVQYTGYEDMGPSNAECRVSSFHELKRWLMEMN
jgi:FMN phosphatase YigB (HAD superfamily)